MSEFQFLNKRTIDHMLERKAPQESVQTTKITLTYSGSGWSSQALHSIKMSEHLYWVYMRIAYTGSIPASSSITVCNDFKIDGKTVEGGQTFYAMTTGGSSGITPIGAYVPENGKLVFRSIDVDGTANGVVWLQGVLYCS